MADPTPTSEWQPIETAPKDGRDILLGWRYGGRWMVTVAHWTFWKSWDGRPRVDGSWYVVRGNGNTAPRDGWVWMPLPPPPGGVR